MGQFTVVSLGLLAVFLSLSGAKGDNCPANWISRNGVCNKLFPDRKTWLEAEMYCRALKPGCHLASLHRDSDSTVLAWYISDHFKGAGHVWIGLRDTNRKRTWKWSDRTSTNYFSWNQGEPNNVQDNENCVHLWAPSGYLKWNDEPCASLHPFICQYKL
uniref:C-type lectin lectoxin-Enh5 n=1 Tax=Pseudoferania polylepis TaxID=338839 RepID=LECM5_PSEPL|nr:RecName: Full=C-type lectin lectoxin-Enh5; Short=CTL; Flags: Precursor [Pseudoferania polylepis]ABU68493.1 Lectoxin-Enh5 [Pseudoferania polylepis]